MICKAGRVSVSASPTSLNKHMFVVTVPDTMCHPKITKYAAGPQMKEKWYFTMPGWYPSIQN
jgi:hypothetical protein